MDEKELEALHKALSQQFDIGDYDTFKSKMQTPDDRKNFYNAVGEKGFDLGDFDEYEKRLGGVKKKVGSINFEKSSLQSGNDLSQSQSPSPLHSEESGSINPILGEITQIKDLESRTKDIPMTSSGKGGNIVVKAPDDVSIGEAKKKKEQFKELYGIDADEFSSEIEGLPEIAYTQKGFTPEELIQIKKDNPQNYQRRIATAKVQVGLRDKINQQFADGNIDEETRQYLINSSKSNTNNYNVGDYNQQRGIVKGQAALIDQVGGEDAEKLKSALATERSKVYGDAYKNGFDNIVKDSEESKYLSNNALLGYQYIKDLSPEKAKQYERLFIDAKSLKDKPNEQKGYNHLMQTLEETGVNLQLNAINEDLNSLNKEAKNNGGGLSPEQLSKAEQLEKKYNELTTYNNELDSKYPDRVDNKVDDALQEVLGQRANFGGYLAGKLFTSVAHTAEGVWEAVSSPFMSDASNNMRELAIMGENLKEQYTFHKTDKNKSINDSQLLIQPELQSQIDIVKNNKSLSDEQKEKQVTSLLKNNLDKFGRVPIKGGKFDVSPSSILYGVTDIAATLVPFIALESVTGGGASAGAARKFISTFTAAAATSFHDEYAAAIMDGKPQSEAYKYAMASTAISSFAMAGAGTAEAIKKMAGMETSAGKIINKMTDSEISAMMSKTPKALRGIAERVKATPKMFAEGAKAGAKFEGFMAAGNELKNQVLGTPIDREQNFKQSLIGVLNFGILGAGLGHIGYKSPTELQKSSFLETGKNPTEFIEQARQMVKEGNLSSTDFEQVKNNIESSAAAYKNLPTTNSKGQPLSEKDKGDYLYNEAVKNEALKKQLPPRQKEKAENTALVADFKNDYILEPKNNTELQIIKKQLEKSLEPKKDAEGKTIEPNEKEVKESKAELEAINDIIENKPKEEVDTKLSEPIEGLDEQGVPIGENVPPPPTNNSKAGEVEQPAKEEFRLNKDNKDEFITKTGNQKVKFEKEDLIVVDAKTGKEVPAKTKKKALQEFAENFDYTHGEKSIEMPKGIITDNDVKSHIIETSKNPYEIAELYINEEPTTQPISSIERMIADYGIGKVKGNSYNEFGDRNNMTFGKAKSYINKDGYSIDVIAKEMSDHYGVEISPADITNFMDRFPNGERQALKLVESDIAIKAANKFKELTGLNLNNEIAEKAINQQFNKLSKQEQAIAKNDYETKQQLEEAYWSAHKETNGFTEESRNNKVEQASGSKEGGQKPPIETIQKAEIATGEDGIGITHAQTAELRKEKGFDAYEKEPKKFAEWDAEADKRIADNKMPELIKRMERGDEIDAVEQRMMGKYIATLNAEVSKNPTKGNIANLKKAVELSDIVGGRQIGQSLVARKGTFLPDDSLGKYIIEETEAYGVKDLPQETINQLKNRFDKEQELQKQIEEAYKKGREEALKENAKNEFSKIISSTKKVRKTKEEFVSERKDIIQQMRADLLKVAKGGSGTMLTIPLAPQLIAIAPHVAKLVKSLAQEGFYKLEDVINKVHDELKDIVPVSKKDVRDLIAGEYNEKKSTRNEIAETIRNLQSESKLLNELERVRKDEPKTTENQIKKDSRIQELENKIKEVKKLKKIKGLDEPVKDISVEDEAKISARKKQILNQVAKLQEDIKNKKYEQVAEPTRKLKLDKETQKLQDRLIEMKRQDAVRRAKADYNKMAKWRKVVDTILQVTGIRRLIQAAVDFSIPFRQAVAITINPLKYFKVEKGKLKSNTALKAWGNMFGLAFSPKKYNRFQYHLENSELGKMFTKSEGVFSNPSEIRMDKREEEFTTSIFGRIRQKIDEGENKILQKGADIVDKAWFSERAAAGFLNTVRIEEFAKQVKNLEKQGKTPENSPNDYKEATKWVMNITGRGNMLKMLEDSKSGKQYANQVYFGARLMAAKINMLNPVYYAKMPKEVRVQALKDMAGAVTSMFLIGYAAVQAGASVSFNPDDPDFLQIRVGDKVYDISGGSVGYVRTFMRLVKSVFSDTNYKNFAMKSAVKTLVTNKFAPNVSYLYHGLTGKSGEYDKNGKLKDFDPTEILEYEPLYVDDTKEAIKEEGLGALITTFAPNIFGIGYQKYPKK